MTAYPLRTTDERTIRIDTALKTLRLWASRHTQRIELAQMEEHRLNDIGRSRIEVRRECSKWFWQK